MNVNIQATVRVEADSEEKAFEAISNSSPGIFTSSYVVFNPYSKVHSVTPTVAKEVKYSIPKCEKCGAEIAMLKCIEAFSSNVTYTSDVVLEGSRLVKKGTGEPDIEDKDLLEAHYLCPFCEAELADSLDDAIDILKGDIQPL